MKTNKEFSDEPFSIFRPILTFDVAGIKVEQTNFGFRIYTHNYFKAQRVLLYLKNEGFAEQGDSETEKI